MKWVILLFMVIIVGVGFLQHSIHEESIKETTIELYEENDLGSIKIDGINLPLSFTFLAQKVVAEVFYTDEDGHDRSVEIIVTPIESLPIVSIFTGSNYQINFALGINNLLKGLSGQFAP